MVGLEDLLKSLSNRIREEAAEEQALKKQVATVEVQWEPFGLQAFEKIVIPFLSLIEEKTSFEGEGELSGRTAFYRSWTAERNPDMSSNEVQFIDELNHVRYLLSYIATDQGFKNIFLDVIGNDAQDEEITGYLDEEMNYLQEHALQVCIAIFTGRPLEDYPALSPYELEEFKNQILLWAPILESAVAELPEDVITIPLSEHADSIKTGLIIYRARKKAGWFIKVVRAPLNLPLALDDYPQVEFQFYEGQALHRLEIRSKGGDSSENHYFLSNQGNITVLSRKSQFGQFSRSEVSESDEFLVTLMVQLTHHFELNKWQSNPTDQFSQKTN